VSPAHRPMLNMVRAVLNGATAAGWERPVAALNVDGRDRR
jgi:hypothetical protein